jgi:hypothetical protein
MPLKYFPIFKKKANSSQHLFCPTQQQTQLSPFKKKKKKKRMASSSLELRLPIVHVLHALLFPLKLETVLFGEAIPFSSSPIAIDCNRFPSPSPGLFSSVTSCPFFSTPPSLVFFLGKDDPLLVHSNPCWKKKKKTVLSFRPLIKHLTLTLFLLLLHPNHTRKGNH